MGIHTSPYEWQLTPSEFDTDKGAYYAKSNMPEKRKKAKFLNLPIDDAFSIGYERKSQFIKRLAKKEQEKDSTQNIDTIKNKIKANFNALYKLNDWYKLNIATFNNDENEKKSKLGKLAHLKGDREYQEDQAVLDSIKIDNAYQAIDVAHACSKSLIRAHMAMIGENMSGGTTFTGSVQFANSSTGNIDIVTANVGDSATGLIKKIRTMDGKQRYHCEMLSYEHTGKVVKTVGKGKDAITYTLNMSRSLGDKDIVKPTKNTAPAVSANETLTYKIETPQYTVLSISPTESEGAFLVHACDGAWDVFSAEYMGLLADYFFDSDNAEPDIDLIEQLAAVKLFVKGISELAQEYDAILYMTSFADIKATTITAKFATLLYNIIVQGQLEFSKESKGKIKEILKNKMDKLTSELQKNLDKFESDLKQATNEEDKERILEERENRISSLLKDFSFIDVIKEGLTAEHITDAKKDFADIKAKNKDNFNKFVIEMAYLFGSTDNISVVTANIKKNTVSAVLDGHSHDVYTAKALVEFTAKGFKTNLHASLTLTRAINRIKKADKTVLDGKVKAGLLSGLYNTENFVTSELIRIDALYSDTEKAQEYKKLEDYTNDIDTLTKSVLEPEVKLKQDDKLKEIQAFRSKHKNYVNEACKHHVRKGDYDKDWPFWLAAFVGATVGAVGAALLTGLIAAVAMGFFGPAGIPIGIIAVCKGAAISNFFYVQAAVALIAFLGVGYYTKKQYYNEKWDVPILSRVFPFLIFNKKTR